MLSDTTSNSGNACRRLGIGRWCLSLVAGLFVIGQAEAAINPGYLNEMPQPDRVIAEIHGADRFDTAARQAGALYQLREVVMELSDGRQYRNRLTADEHRLMSSYVDAAARVMAPILASFDPEEMRRLGMNSPRAKWIGLRTHYELDKAFRDELLERFLSPALRANYRAIESRQEQSLARSRAQQGGALPRPQSGPFGTRFGMGLSGPRITMLSMGVLGFLLLLGIARETRPFGIDSSDPFKLRAGWARYNLYSVTGAVISPSKAIETVTQVSGGAYNQGVSSSSHRSVHDQFFVRDPGGGERAFQTVDVNLALREGHRLSVVWAIRKGKERGPYILFSNHSTGDRTMVDGVLRDILKPKNWPVLPFAALAWMLPGYAVIPLRYLLTMTGLQTGRTFGGVFMGVSAFIVFFIIRAIVFRLRMRRFKKEDIAALLTILDARAKEQERG